MPRRLVILLVCLIAAGVPIRARAGGQSASRDLGRAGWAALQAGDADRAASLFGEALTLRPGDALLNLGAGAAAHARGRDREAERWLKEAVRLEPRLTPASELLGEIAYHDGDLDLAIKTYESALAQAPQNAALRQRLEAWRSEAVVHHGFEAVKDDRFTILFEGPVDQRLAVRAASVLNAAFRRVAGALGTYPSDSITAILYSERQFRDITGAPEWSAGGFDGQIRVPVRGAAQNLDEFDRVLTHELVHAMLRSIASRNLPAWLNEGLAMYFEGRDAGLAERRLGAARLFVPLSALQTSYARLTALQAAVAYEESLFAANALVDRIGATGTRLVLQDLDGGETVEQSVGRFGFTLAEFEADLSRRVGAAPRPTARR
jgi:peptidase MA superfamily protein/tetratricopeptide repeat protein